MTPEIERCLADLDRRLNSPQEEALRAAWLAFWEGQGSDDVFVPPSRRPVPPSVSWPCVTVNEAIRDLDAMLLQQFGACSHALARGSNNLLGVRCNYGTGILPSLFGCDLFWMDEVSDTLPTARPLGTADAVRRLLDRGVPDVSSGLGERLFAAAERFLEVFRRFPNIAAHVALYHPDWQGPMDVAEMVWGSEVFLAFYDAPDLLRDFLHLITDTYAAFARAWFARVGAPGRYSVHWSFLIRGTLMLRTDSLMNLSPEAYVEFIRPLDQRLFDEFGGGAVHFCGRGSHYIAALSELHGLYAVNLSQPHLNDMEDILCHTVDKGIRILGYPWAMRPLERRRLRGLVHCARMNGA